ncbi:MAG: tRNA (adenosine(37)-N6)-dimethylallyltransferase MiaA [Caldilineaceae bacterium]|nr:tRNA (adenosine(37)-N6)-dimethylallyltransferase MiaA [Caldilineaceae bacterium]
MTRRQAESSAPQVLVIAGPTGIGKTALTRNLGLLLPIEVVNADSRQVYRRMDIGTAMPTPQDQAACPHHLFAVREPDQPLTLAEFQAQAVACIHDIMERRKVPVLAGGTPLYLRSVTENLQIPEVEPMPALRKELEAKLVRLGPAPLYNRLQSLDPETARATDPSNGRRIIRALEIFVATGRSKVALEGRRSPLWRLLKIGLTCPRPMLHARIDARVDAMMDSGLLAETDNLLAAGYDPGLPALSALGYRQLIQFRQGCGSLAEAVDAIKTSTHRYVRHQYTWFRRMEGIRWYDTSQVGLDCIARDIHTDFAVDRPAETLGTA